MPRSRQRADGSQSSSVEQRPSLRRQIPDPGSPDGTQKSPAPHWLSSAEGLQASPVSATQSPGGT
jgi:hypothetical protein